MSYHFGKHSTRQTKSWERIFDLGPISRVRVSRGELCNIYKIKSLWNWFFCFLIWSPINSRVVVGWGRVCLWGNNWRMGAFCLVCIFHNQNMHVYLILVLYELKITLMVRLGFEPGSAGWKAQEIFVTLKHSLLYAVYECAMTYLQLKIIWNEHTRIVDMYKTLESNKRHFWFYSSAPQL